MRCACGGDLAAKATRLTADGRLRRSRECTACGQRVKTIEITEADLKALGHVRERLRLTQKKRRAAMSPAKRALIGKRARLRRAARKEAAQTGEPVQAIYQRWGCG